MTIVKIQTYPDDNAARQAVRGIVQDIAPYDDMEQAHISDVLAWIDSEEPLFRIAKPDTPNKHLVSYFLLFDEAASKVLLVDHKNAHLWLPSGGHVEVCEDPAEAVRRECMEELGVHADFWCDEPIFLTVTTTQGVSRPHTDVSLWYVLRGDHHQSYVFDTEEFHSIRWFDIDNLPYERTDPHMRRFIGKLKHSARKHNPRAENRIKSYF